MNSQTLLLRQVNPDWMREGRPTSQTFRPFPKDNLQLSVSDSDMIAAYDAWVKFTAKGYLSCGVVAVTVGESEKINLDVRSDPQPEQSEHVVIDFGQISSRSRRNDIAKILVALAINRDWLYRQ